MNIILSILLVGFYCILGAAILGVIATAITWWIVFVIRLILFGYSEVIEKLKGKLKR